VLSAGWLGPTKFWDWGRTARVRPVFSWVGERQPPGWPIGGARRGLRIPYPYPSTLTLMDGLRIPYPYPSTLTLIGWPQDPLPLPLNPNPDWMASGSHPLSRVPCTS
jgi:hypothetical protein